MDIEREDIAWDGHAVQWLTSCVRIGLRFGFGRQCAVLVGRDMIDGR